LNSSKLKTFLFFFILLALNACAETEQPGYANSTLIVFGDSLSDIGNARIATSGIIPDKNYYNGRFSNGPNYVDQLAANLNITINASRSFGSNYAFGGARSIEVNAQVSNYKENVESTANPEALYIVWSGGNDLIEILQNADTSNTIDTAIAHIEDAIRKLSLIGATRILVPNQANLAYIPRLVELENTFPGIQTTATELTNQFNAALNAMLDRLTTEESIITMRFDTFSLFAAIIANPSRYNLSNVTDRCYVRSNLSLELSGDETICENPSAYLFWDDLHPSNTTHELIANAIILLVGQQ